MTTTSVGRSTAVGEIERRATIGIVGSGDIVSQVHLPSLLARRDVSVAWITDIARDRAVRVGRAFGVRALELSCDPEALPDADIVLLAVPYGVRRPYYEILARRGIAVYAEKPFARTEAEHREICSWFPRSRLACGLQRRLFGPAILVKAAIDAGLFGRLRRVEYDFGQAGLMPSGKFYDRVDLAGGGLLFEMAIHGLDTLLYCGGARDVVVHDANMVFEGGLDLHTEARFSIEREGDENIEGMLLVSCLVETRRSLHFQFDNAGVSFSFGSEIVAVRTKDTQIDLAMSPGAGWVLATTPDQLFYDFWSLFIDGVKAGRENLTSASRSILTTRFVERLYDAGSAATETS